MTINEPTFEATAPVGRLAPTGYDGMPLLEYLDRADPDRQLADPEARAELMAEIDPFAAAIAIRLVHQQVAHSPNLDFHPSANRIGPGGTQGNYFTSYLGVQPDRRAEVIEYALVASNFVAAQGNLQTAGDILGGATVATQAFTDCNKRTGRAIQLLVGHGFDGSDEDRALYREIVYTDRHDPKKGALVHPHDMCNCLEFVDEITSATPTESRQLEILSAHWRVRKPHFFLLRSALTDDVEATEALEVISAIQEDVFGPYLLTSQLGLDYESMDVPRDVLENRALALVRQLNAQGAKDLVERSRQLKVEFIQFLVDRTVMLAQGAEDIDPGVNILGSNDYPAIA